MTRERAAGRTDRASLLMQATPDTVHAAFLDPDAFAKWLPPHGMHATIHTFDPRPGGAFELTLTYDEPDPATQGKTTDDSDRVAGRFVELAAGRRVVWDVEFASDDPAFAGTMRMTWSFAPQGDGTLVTIVAENVPPGIRAEDHAQGLAATLGNLAGYVERHTGTGG